MPECKQCGRAERWSIRGVRNITVNKDGICPVCVEVNQEIAFEDKERLRKARKLVAAASK